MSCLQRVMAVSVLQKTASSRVCQCLCSFFRFCPCLDFAPFFNFLFLNSKVPEVCRLSTAAATFLSRFFFTYSKNKIYTKSNLEVERRRTGYTFVCFCYIGVSSERTVI